MEENPFRQMLRLNDELKQMKREMDVLVSKNRRIADDMERISQRVGEADKIGSE
jgi:hypothetical protein